MKRHSKLICWLLLLCLLCVSVKPVYAERSKEDVERERERSQQNLNQAENEAAAIEGEKEAAEAAVNESEEQLVEILTSVGIIEDEIEVKNKAVDEAKEQYDEAKKKEETQYYAMRRRIRYMYEHGENLSPYMHLFTDSGSFAEALNRSEYAEEIYEYDRKLLTNYQKIKEDVKRSEEKLEQEIDELNEVKETYEEESKELQDMIDRQKRVVEDFASQLSSARAKAAQYRNEISKQNEEIRQIAAAEERAREEKRKAEEAAKRKAEEEKRKAEEAARAAEEARRKAQEAAENEAEEYRRRAEEAAEEAAAEADRLRKEAEEAARKQAEEWEKAQKEAEEAARRAAQGGGGSAKGSEIASFAKQFIGNPYVLGGTSLTNGCDCSGFIMSVYSHFGYSVPRTSWEQRGAGRAVSYSEAQPGDIVCYAGHVGLYVGGGTIVHASTPASGIKLTPATYREILTIRRIV